MINRFIALLLFFLLVPVFTLIAIVIIIFDGLPIIFIQQRVGLNNKLFSFFKFRTMKKNVANIASHKLENSKDKLTLTGKFLRKYSFDELPQLVNIIKGEMLFIGPRPALFNQDDLIKLRKEKNVHLIKPGITGWAQINGRDEISIAKKVELDEFYLKNKSFLMNLKILTITIAQVVLPKNISH